MGVLQDKVAIVTGGGQGLGFAIARVYADEGAKLVLTGRVKDKLDGKAEQLRARGGEVLTIQADVRLRSAAKEVVAKTLDAFGRIDVLVNNAQMLTPYKPFQDHTDEDLEANIQSGLFGAIYMMQEAYPALKRQGGAVINLGSSVGEQGVAWTVGYSAAKEAIRAATRVAAREWGRDNIRVNIINPGATSETFDKFFEGRPEVLAKLEGDCAFGRFAEPVKDLGPLAVYLASPDCFITGQTLHCDGGRQMHT